MNYKETLFFIGKCLTITHEEHNRILVEQKLKKGNIDWDSVVKISTAHYVFPALYCNLKRVDFLHYLPQDLVEYMKHITDLNRERNQQIIEQAQEINKLLLNHNITPIFLKGTGNLLSGLYKDIAERMVGDIDFLVAEQNIEKTNNVLLEHGYSKVQNTTYDFPSFKHLPRMQKKGKIAAIEIHKHILREKYSKEFDYDHIKNSLININNTFFLSYENQLALSIFAKQINDEGQFYKDISLRNSYDVFLLSTKCNSLKAAENFDQLFNPLNNYLANTQKAFNSQSIQFKLTENSKKHTTDFFFLLENPSIAKKRRKKTSLNLFLKERLSIVQKSISDKKTRLWLFKRLTDKQWYKEKMVQLGFIKPNS